MGFLLVFIGGGIGSAFRHGVNMLAARHLAGVFPWGTLAINVVGCLLMGVLTEYFALRSHLSMELRLFLATGILGGFTTFSTYSLEVVLLDARGATLLAVLYAVGSVVLGVAALIGGMAAVRAMS